MEQHTARCGPNPLFIVSATVAVIRVTVFQTGCLDVKEFVSDD